MKRKLLFLSFLLILLFGFCNIIYGNNTANNLLMSSAPNYANYAGFGNKNLVYHKFTEMKTAVYGWNHYHMGMYDPVTLKAKTYPQIKDSNGKTIPSIHEVHCFFGLTYVRFADDQGLISFPANP